MPLTTSRYISSDSGTQQKVHERGYASYLKPERRKEILEYNSKVFDRLVDISGRKPGSSFDVQHSKN